MKKKTGSPANPPRSGEGAGKSGVLTPRVVQFLVERHCPARAAFCRHVKHDPFPIWVRWPPQPAHGHCDGKYVYVLDAEQGNGIRRRFGMPAQRMDVYYVCDHMGHVIE